MSHQPTRLPPPDASPGLSPRMQGILLGIIVGAVSASLYFVWAL